MEGLPCLKPFPVSLHQDMKTKAGQLKLMKDVALRREVSGLNARDKKPQLTRSLTWKA